MAEILERRSTLAIKLELSSLTGTSSSSGTAVTGSGTAFTTELVVGDVIGTVANGFRRVTSITDATHLAVDVAFDVALSGATVQLSDYAADPTITSADVIEFVSPFGLEPDRAEIERNVIRDTFDDLASVQGDESVAGDITVELKGSGTAGTPPETDPLYHCAIGESRISTASVTVSGSTTSTVKLDTGDGVNHRVGEPIMLDTSIAGSGAYEVAFVTEINSNDLTVSPLLTLAPPTGRTVAAAVHYKVSKNELKSFWGQFWRGDVTLEVYKGCKVNSLTMEFRTGQPINPRFSTKAKETAAPTSAAYGLGTPTYDGTDVHIARYMVVKVGGTLYPVSDISFTVTNDLYEQKAVTTAGLQKLLRTRRQVTGSFSMVYENKDIETAFRNGTTAELIIVSSKGDAALTLGNTFAIRMPKIRYTKAGKTVDSGIFKWDIPFKAVLTLGEDSISALSFM